MRFWFQGGWRWKYKLSSLQKEKKKSSAREQLHHVRIVTCKKNARVEGLTWAVQEDSVWEVTLCCGRRASFCFYQQDSSHLQPDFLFFFVLAAPFCDNKGFTPSCCRSVMSRPVGLWWGGASLGFLTQLLSFCRRAISFLLHGLQTVGRNEHAQFYLEMHLNGIDLNCCCWINLRRSLFCSPEKLLSFFHFCLTASRLFGLKWGQNTPSARPCRPTRGLWGKKIDAGAPNEVVVVVVTLLNLFRNIHM